MSEATEGIPAEVTLPPDIGDIPVEIPPKSNEIEFDVSEELRQGESFNPDIHCSNDDGSPKRNKDGTFRRKPLRKQPEATQVGSPSPPPANAIPAEDAFNSPAPISTIQFVSMTLEITSLALISTVGDEWRFNEAEKSILIDIWSRYVHYKGWDGSFSPEVAISFATIPIVLPRIVVGWKKWKIKNAQRRHRETGNGEKQSGESNHPAEQIPVSDNGDRSAGG